MANIMLTDICNLRCPYCFANEFVNKSANEISIENFKRALDFIATEPNAKLGLIGGEPTIHTQFAELLKIVISDPRYKDVVLFTNGVKFEEFANELSHPKFHILLNCNSPKDIGQKAFDKMVANLDLMVNKYYMHDRVTLGINIYKPDFDFDYILELLKKYNFQRVRMSITVPNTSEKRDFNVKDYFSSIKPRFKEFIYAMLSNDIMPTYDCNKMPTCVLTEKEMMEFNELITKRQRDREMRRLPPLPMPHVSSAINTDVVNCAPVVDIRQDLTAVRCFGLSDCTKVKISDFKSLPDLRNYYMNEIDHYAFKFGIDNECENCYRRKTLRCTGACIAFKIAEILDYKKKHGSYIKGVRDEK